MAFIKKNECNDKDLVDYIDAVEMISDELHEVIEKHSAIYKNQVLLAAATSLFLSALNNIDTTVATNVAKSILEKMEGDKPEDGQAN